jgi:hypothetical protein
MTVKFASAKVDLTKEAEGEWVPSRAFPGVEFRVSSIQLPAFATARDMLFQRWARKYKGQPVPLDVKHDELGKLVAKHILHGWRGFDEEYSPELADKALRDREYRDLLGDIELCASQVGEANVQFVEDEAGNSGAPSAKG